MTRLPQLDVSRYPKQQSLTGHITIFVPPPTVQTFEILSGFTLALLTVPGVPIGPNLSTGQVRRCLILDIDKYKLSKLARLLEKRNKTLTVSMANIQTSYILPCLQLRDLQPRPAVSRSRG